MARLSRTLEALSPFIAEREGGAVSGQQRGLRPFACSSPRVTRRPPTQAGLAETTVPRRLRGAGGRSRGLAHVSEARAEGLELGGGGGCGEPRRPG